MLATKISIDAKLAKKNVIQENLIDFLVYSLGDVIFQPYCHYLNTQ